MTADTEELLVQTESLDLNLVAEGRTLAGFEKALLPQVRELRLLNSPPWVRHLGKLALEVSTQGWKFPMPPEPAAPAEAEPTAEAPQATKQVYDLTGETPTRILPPRDKVLFKDRLLYLLQPSLENLFAGRELNLPFKPFPYQMKGIAFLMPRESALLADEMGLGKAQPLDARILTPSGWRRMGDMQVGDVVVSARGGFSRVVGVYPQGDLFIWRVTFSDGSATECCDEHLWQVRDPARVVSLAELRQTPGWSIPLVLPLTFSGPALNVDAYSLGHRQSANGVGLPGETLWCPLSQRLALLQGLFDAAGEPVPEGGIRYSARSPRLAEDVRFLVQSLGGTASGDQTLHIVLPPAIEPFRRPGKDAAYRASRRIAPRRQVVAITPVGLRPAQCIAVDAPDHLYVTDDCIVTHNTMQSIVAMRLLFHGGFIQRALVVCPKPLVINWTRELRMWAPDVPFEMVTGDTESRRAIWNVSNCPLKLVNYELLTRDANFVLDENISFDLVVLDEAQRIKTRESKTAQVVRSIKRSRSWAMSGTPVENRPDDLVNIFAFVDPQKVPPDTPTQKLPDLTSDSILRRTKEEAAPDMPPRIYRDSYLELTAAQRESYDLAEKDGVIRLNALENTITVQHVFELVMRLKQICNFDPLTGQSAKMEQLLSDMAEVAESNRKAIIFSQWVEPLEVLARALEQYGPLLYHGKVPHAERQGILDRFKADPDKHVILMSYGTGSVGLNLQFTNYVFLFDRWWNPAIEDQAINRAHRLGQRDPVFVTRFVSQNTIEGRIADILEKKRQLFQELIAQNGPPSSLGLTEAEIFGLFRIQARPRR